MATDAKLNRYAEHIGRLLRPPEDERAKLRLVVEVVREVWSQ
jgi:hypothetical protein